MTANHTQPNGKVKRLYKSLETALMAQNILVWSEPLPTVLFGLRSAMNEDSAYTIAQMVFG